MFNKIEKVQFPKPQGTIINMMPIVYGNEETWPEPVKAYRSLIVSSPFPDGSVCYVSIHESFVHKGDSQRRPGIHTEGTLSLGWGGGTWGGSQGLYMASTDGSCRIWDCTRLDGDAHGALQEEPDAPVHHMEPEMLYWLTDRTPHEALPVAQDGIRQWFRLVSEDIGGWFSQHNTPNPLGVLPTAPIVHYNKFL